MTNEETRESRRKIRNIHDWLGRWGWRCAIVIAALGLAVVVCWHWHSIQVFICPIWLDFGVNSGERSRNMVLTVVPILALVGLFMAHWRNRIADKQTETSERGLQNDRYQKGAEMLGGGVLAVRMGGVLALAQLASEQPKEYHIQTMKLLCAAILHPSGDAHSSGASDATSDDENSPHCPPDIELAAQVIGRRTEGQRKIETKNEWRPDLKGANLTRADLKGANLAETYLYGAIMDYANLGDANLTGANLTCAKLIRSAMIGADLTGAYLEGANLTGANLQYANLTDANLACAILTGAYLQYANLTGAYLEDANLTRADLKGANLTGAYLQYANLAGAYLEGANLTGANLQYANLTGTYLKGADLTGADLYGANLTDADISGAILAGVQNLTQAQINSAEAWKNNLPNLPNNVCTETGEPLVWGGKTKNVDQSGFPSDLSPSP